MRFGDDAAQLGVFQLRLNGGGDWSDTGYYGIADNDRVCLSMSNHEGRLPA